MLTPNERQPLMETEPTQQTSSPTPDSPSGQAPPPPPPPPPPTPESLREELEKQKLAQEKLSQKNAASSDYVAKAEKAGSDVAKAIEDYKKAYDKQLLLKQDAERTNKCESDDATSEIGD